MHGMAIPRSSKRVTLSTKVNCNHNYCTYRCDDSCRHSRVTLGLLS